MINLFFSIFKFSFFIPFLLNWCLKLELKALKIKSFKEVEIFMSYNRRIMIAFLHCWLSKLFFLSLQKFKYRSNFLGCFFQ